MLVRCAPFCSSVACHSMGKASVIHFDIALAMLMYLNAHETVDKHNKVDWDAVHLLHIACIDT